jgi:chromosome partitioning protein
VQLNRERQNIRHSQAWLQSASWTAVSSHLCLKSILKDLSMRTYSVTNNKGGTAKTTTALNLGAALKAKGFRVLAIDLDSQCNLTLGIGITPGEHHAGTLLLGDSSFEEACVVTPSFDLIPSHRNLLSYEYRINTEPDSAFFLKDALVGKQYDYVIIDCPPSLGALTVNALVASDFFIIPMQGENFAYVGLNEILQLTSKIKKRLNPELELAGILLSKFDLRTKFAQLVYQKLAVNEDIKVFKTFIRQDVNLMECAAYGENIFTYAPDSRGAADYLTLCEEVITL